MLAMTETFIIATTGGAMFSLLYLPMPWMLGPLTFVLLWKSLTRRLLAWSIGLRNGGLMIMGYIMGSSFTYETLHNIALQLPAMLFATIATIGFALILGHWMYHKTGITTQTILLGSVPGGLSQMTVLCEEIPEADLSFVTFMQTVRLLAVVFIVPFLALNGTLGSGSIQVGGDISIKALVYSPFNWLIFTLLVLIGSYIAYRMNSPTPYLLGPVIASAALVVNGLQAPPVPALLVTLSQICIGTFIGLSVDVDSIRRWKKLLPYTIIGGIGVVIFSIIIGYILAAVYPIDLITAFLSTAPGGMAEMGVTATLVQADISTVTAYQLFRFFFILFIVPLIIRWWLRRSSDRT